VADLVVVAFDNQTGAAEMRDALVDLQEQRLVSLYDAAVVVWQLDGDVRVTQAANLMKADALDGAFWGMLGEIMFGLPPEPLARPPARSPARGYPLPRAQSVRASDAMGDALLDVGVGDGFVREVGRAIKPGHSALFLLVREATPDRLLAELKQFNGKILQTSLSQEAEARLKESFGIHKE